MLDMALSAACESGFQTGETSSHIHLWVYDGFMVAIRGTLSRGRWVVVSVHKLNKNAVSPPFPDFSEPEILNAGCIRTESDAHVDSNPALLCVGQLELCPFAK